MSLNSDSCPRPKLPRHQNTGPLTRLRSQPGAISHSRRRPPLTLRRLDPRREKKSRSIVAGSNRPRELKPAAMSKSFSSSTLVAICAIVIFVALSSGALAGELEWVGMSAVVAGGGTAQCNGSVGECTEMEEEFGLDSETNRRILATSRYISYGALRRNTVPCSRRGASYYNCRPGAQANPYSRGCSTITRCRS